MGDHPRIRGEHEAKADAIVRGAGIIPAYAGSTCEERQHHQRSPGSSPHTRGAPVPVGLRNRRHRDHPRIRGEHVCIGRAHAGHERIIPAYAGSTTPRPHTQSRTSGSSPHTRGAPPASECAEGHAEDHPRIRGEHGQGRGQEGRCVGIIPAYAGSTKSPSPASFLAVGLSPHTRGAPQTPGLRCTGTGDHPRIRGEHSPPCAITSATPGIIPAYAGSTLRCTGTGSWRWDHPRIRGEHMAQAAREIVGDRIIPAYAGSTTCRAANRCRLIGSSPHTRGALPSSRIPDGAREDHPRIRGEHLSDLPGEHDGPGIIPAYAGSTPRPSRAGAPFSGSSPHTRGAPARASSTGHATRDHPRIRGEHSRAVFDDRPAVGIIPAYAGSTKYALSRSRPSAGSSPHTRGAPPTSRRRTRPRRDHPRIRGEHPGNPLAEVVGAGIIPAYAGSTHTSMYGSEGNSGSSPHTRGALYLCLVLSHGRQDHPRIRGEHGAEHRLLCGRRRIIPAYAGSTV